MFKLSSIVLIVHHLHSYDYCASLTHLYYYQAEHRTMAAFVLAMIVNDFSSGQEAALQSNLIALCLEQLTDSHALLRQWLALCLAKVMMHSLIGCCITLCDWLNINCIVLLA